jgi:hypothetical protein
MNDARITMIMLAALFFGFEVNALDYYWKAANGTEGFFETSGNWMIDGVPVGSGYPGENDTIFCTNGPQKIIFTTPGATNKLTAISLNRISYTQNQQIEIDLNGGELQVSGLIAMKASRYEGVVRPYLFVTNGTLHAGGGIACAGDDNNYRGYFKANGPNTKVFSNGNISSLGAGSRVEIENGAEVTFLNGYPLLSNGVGSSYNEENNLAKFIVQGEGTCLVSTNGFRVCTSCRMSIRDKAKAFFSNYARAAQYGRQDRSSVGVDLGGTLSGQAEFEVDDAEVSITNGASIMIAESDRCGLINHMLTLKNNAKFNFAGSSMVNLAYTQSQSNLITNNQIRVFSGSRLSSDGNTAASGTTTIGSIVVGSGTGGQIFENGIHVSNGVVSVNGICLSSSGYCSNNWIRIEGAQSRVLLNKPFANPSDLPNNVYVAALGLYNRSRVEFLIGEDGFENPPIECTTEVGRIYGSQTEDKRAKIVVEDRGFAKRHPGVTVTLIKTINALNRPYLEQLAADSIVIAEREKDVGKVSVSADGMSLQYTSPHKDGLVVIFF